jgi:hypothetical protein
MCQMTSYYDEKRHAGEVFAPVKLPDVPITWRLKERMKVSQGLHGMLHEILTNPARNYWFLHGIHGGVVDRGCQAGDGPLALLTGVAKASAGLPRHPVVSLRSLYTRIRV